MGRMLVSLVMVRADLLCVTDFRWISQRSTGTAIPMVVMPAAPANAVPEHRQASQYGQEMRIHGLQITGESTQMISFSSLSGNITSLVNPIFRFARIEVPGGGISGFYGKNGE